MVFDQLKQDGERQTAVSRSPWRLFIVGIGLALAISVGLMVVVMRAPATDITTLVTTLSITSLVSLGLGYLVMRRGWARFTSINQTLLLTYVWSAILVFFNVWFMLSRMYFSPHDFQLSGVLLLFAVIISTTFGIFAAANVTDGLHQLEVSANQIADGNLDARASIQGRDEVARLGQVFNEMAAQLQAAEAQRQELDKLRRDLIAWTSHDLRTPLTSIRAMIEALHDGLVTEPETVQRYYRTIRTDIIALNTLIDDLFELAQLDAGGLEMEMDSHSIRDMISDGLERFQALARQRNVALVGDVAGNVDPVQMNASKMARVLGNLLSNALRYTPTGGQVTVRAWRTADEVLVTVADSGLGFREADLTRIFEQFYRGEEARSRATGGAGLGLAIARGIVEAHNGRIWAENSQEGGAVVGFALPAA